MPSLGADMEFGTVSQWLVKAGDEVHRGDVVAVVETEKSTIEVEIFESGVIDELVVHEGEQVPVGAVLAHLTARAPAAVPGAPPGPPARPETRARPADTGQVPGAPAPGPPTVHSPVTRHLAERLGVDLATLSGSGPSGAVTRADVERAASRKTDKAPRPGQAGRGTSTVAAEGRHPAEPEVQPGSPASDRVRSSPLARRLAADLGVDLSALQGTGPGKSVIEHDVRLAAATAAPEATVAAPVPEAGAPAAEPEARAAATVAAATVAAAQDRQATMRRAIGALMARSKREIPHYYLSTTIDLSTAVSWLEQANLDRPVTSRLVLPVLMLKATARAVARVPEMNGFMIEDAFVPSEPVHVGVAISLRTGGVIAPAIHDADRLPLDELMAQLKDLVGRARAGVLRSSEMSDPTITVSNLGELGVEAVFGVIYPPQVALVGFGRVAEQPWAQGGMLGVRPCVTATLSADHRVSDGHRGGRFLSEIDRLLQEPEKL